LKGKVLAGIAWPFLIFGRACDIQSPLLKVLPEKLEGTLKISNERNVSKSMAGSENVSSSNMASTDLVDVTALVMSAGLMAYSQDQWNVRVRNVCEGMSN
jgi:hypothetical protein